MCFPISIHRKKVHFTVESVLDFCLFCLMKTPNSKCIQARCPRKNIPSIKVQKSLINKKIDTFFTVATEGCYSKKKKHLGFSLNPWTQWTHLSPKLTLIFAHHILIRHKGIHGYIIQILCSRFHTKGASYKIIIKQIKMMIQIDFYLLLLLS